MMSDGGKGSGFHPRGCHSSTTEFSVLNNSKKSDNGILSPKKMPDGERSSGFHLKTEFW
jgi:hypothetical protein